MNSDMEMNFDAIRLGQALRQERNRLGYTLDEASNKTGVSKTMLSQIERGESSPLFRPFGRFPQVFSIFGHSPFP